MLGNMIISKNLSKQVEISKTCEISNVKIKTYDRKLMNYLENNPNKLNGLSGNIEFLKRRRNNLKLSIVNKRREKIKLVC
jgi:hypothetical protein